jgi:AcrR family transcriptional regulator
MRYTVKIGIVPYLVKIDNVPYNPDMQNLQMQPTKRPYRRAEETREHVLDVAGGLFYAEGIHAVGIDRIAEAAQVTTTTLYRLFGSKDGLVAANIRRSDAQWWEWFEPAVKEGGIPAIFDELDRKARDPNNRGCVFRLALTEYPDCDCEVYSLSVENKRRTRERFREILDESGATDPDTTADRLMLIMEGIEASAADRDLKTASSPGPGPSLVRDLLAGRL